MFFAAEAPRDAPYSDDEKILVELISHMLERELERNQYEAQPTKETNLSPVLNRVLRHNLRNEMSIIRGNTQIMTDELGESDAGRHSLDDHPMIYANETFCLLKKSVQNIERSV